MQACGAVSRGAEMELQAALRVRAPWISRVGIFSKLLKRQAWAALAMLGLAFAIAPAHAACTSPQTASIPSGGSATFTCADFGFVSPAVSGPSHGTLTWGTPSNVNALVYTNNGDGLLSDTFVVRDDFNVPITFNVTIGPATSPIVVSPANLPAPAVGVAYSQTLSSSGGVAPYSYSLTGGSLPPGITMSGNTISGTSTGSGPYNFTVTVTDSTAPTALTAVKSYGFTIAAPILDLVQDTPPAATISIPYSLQFTTTGGTSPYSYSIEPGPGLPPGLSMSSTGLVTGTPTAVGSYTFALRYDDSTTISTGGDHFAVQNVTIVVNAAPTIVVDPATVPNPTVGVAYSQTFTGSGGTGPYTFQITAGALPAGLTLSSTGALTGTATAGGTFNFTVEAKDANNFTGTRAYTITTNPPTITLSPTTVPNATMGTAYSQTLTASGGTMGIGYIFNVTAGALPPGLALSSSTGAISGTPTASGTFNFTVTATDRSTGTGAPYTGSQAYTLLVIEIPPVANAVSATVAYNSGANPITLNITGGAPTSVGVLFTPLHGTAIASGTTITYQPETGYAGPDTFSYNATNSAGTSASATVTILVTNPVITVTASGPLTAQIGVPYTQTFTWAGGAAPYSGFNVAGLTGTGLSMTGNTTDSVTISGTPTASGTFSLNASARDSSTGNGPFTVGQIFNLTIAAPTLTMTPAPGNLPMNYGVPTTINFLASGGTAPYSYSLSAGSLPVGVSLSSAGVLSGTPTVPGNYNIAVRVQDGSTGTGAPFSLIQNYTIVVATPAIVIAPATIPGGAVGTPYSATLTASGGVAPYSFSLQAGALPIGMTFSSAGVLSGTPRSDGNFSVTVRATDSNGQNASQVYTFTIAPPTIVIDPATLPGGIAGTAYSATLTASGGIAPYTFSLVSGTLPIGVAFSSAGVVSGTPTTAGTFNMTIRATDDAGYNVTQSYSIVIAAPTITISPATLPGGVVGVPYSQTLSSSGGAAPYTYSIASGNLPIGIAFSSAGVVSGTPTTAGSYTANIRSTDSNGFNATVAYTIVIADAVPVAVADSATTLAGTAVTVPVTANDTGIITSVAVASAPAHGTAAISGLNVIYTPAAGYSGSDTFTYTAIGPGGTSAPATVSITVNPVPVAVSSHVETTAGTVVHVDLTAGATGGPFTAATLVSLSPASSGTATISGSGGSYELTFVPATAFAGLATVTFTLSNAYAVSAPATVEIQVAGRSDPSKDREVLGLLESQASAARRFANSQIGNFQQRMENMHGGAEGRGGFQNNISFAGRQHCSPNSRRAYEDPECAQTALRDEDAPMAAPAPMRSGESGRTPFGFWAGGSVSRGDRDPRTGVSGFDFETSGVSAGGDYRLSPSFVLGGGVGYGRDDTDIGSSGTRSESNAYTVAMYASYHPGERFYLDALLGYQWLSFDNRRFVTDTGGLVRGERDGKQWLASLAAGMDYRSDRLTFSPYARLDLARARLDGYTEQGDPIHALAYHRQDVDTATANLGLRMDYRHDLSWGMFSPQLRLEFQHDFEDDGSATMRYADLPAGPLYRALVRSLDQNRTIFGLGFALQTQHDLRFRVEFRTLFDGDGETDNGFLLNVEKKY